MFHITTNTDSIRGSQIGPPAISLKVPELSHKEEEDEDFTSRANSVRKNKNINDTPRPSKGKPYKK